MASASWANAHGSGETCHHVKDQAHTPAHCNCNCSLSALSGTQVLPR